MAGIQPDTKIAGGDIILRDGKPSGVLVDNAADLVKSKMPALSREDIQNALLAAQKDCFKVGLTTVDDAGLEKTIIDIMDAMQKDGRLDMRIYAMLTDNKENLDYYLAKGPYKTDKLHVCSFKFYADGALGSRGACLLAPYTDSSGHYGFLLKNPEYYHTMAKKIASSKFQMNTHCIGDSAVRFILDTYAEVLNKNKNDRRWRIEHAQVVNEQDFNKFGQFSIIPSVQPTHATSDMKWASMRLGMERLKGAYAYLQLLKQNGIIANGSDFPVEGINPLLGFYAAVARKSVDGKPDTGFQMENALSREEALKGMTIWAAYSNFEENETGSIEIGKKADYVMLDQDIMTVPLNIIPEIKVLNTWIAGHMVYGN
jgi:predicted amidohydrolase YtcJ